ncbi:hypothetical protein LCGC14_1392980 [marine sediment metagenome]|uniref:Uncharacterized protein n=1 Tax=marine sediment metagenome TaxID=412755 RepID=A0A0F9JZI9_9ZZZZ
MIKKILFTILMICICSTAYGGSTRLAKYGVSLTIDFELFEVDGVDFRVDWVPAQADCEIMKDEGASTLCDNTATDEGSTYSIVLTATEMQFARGVLKLSDAATKVFLDSAIIIETYGNASALHAFDLDTASVAQSADNDTKISTLITGVDLNAGAITDASLAGNIEIVFETDFTTNYNTTRNAWVNNYTDIIGTMDAAAFGADFITAAKIADNAIAAEHIAADAIGASEIAADAIGASELAADAIGSSELATTAVDEISDQIWNELMAGHTTADTSGLVMNELQDGGRLDALIDSIIVGVITNAQGADVATDVAAMIDANSRIDVGSWLGTAVTLGNSAPDVNVASEDNIDFGATKKTSLETAVDDAFDNVITASPTTGSRDDVLDRQEESIPQGTITADAQTTTNIISDISITVNDQFNGRIITFRKDTTTANLRGQQTDITGSTAATNTLTITALTNAPQSGDIFEMN